MLCPELAVARVSQPGQDIAVLVQGSSIRRDVNGNIRVGAVQPRDAFRSCD